MNLDYQKLIPEDFHPSSKVWIYQSSRKFFLSEALQIETLLEQFVSEWKSHGVSVKGYANLLFGRFIVLMADETHTGVGGCSIDSSVRVLKEIEKTFNVSLFDRQLLAFIIKEDIQELPLSQFDYAFGNEFLKEDTLYFNNTVSTKDELLHQWIIPVKESWLNKKFILG
jgi:hypothetical protein